VTLLFLVVLLAVAGGFLGKLLGLAGLMFLVTAVMGAALAVALYAGWRKLKER
jgi:hypothetical protein